MKTYFSLSLSHTHTVARNFPSAKQPPKIPYFHDPIHKTLQLKFIIIIIIIPNIVNANTTTTNKITGIKLFLLAHRKGATHFFTVNTEHY